MNNLGDQFGEVLKKVPVKATKPVPRAEPLERPRESTFQTADYLKEELDTAKLRLEELTERFARLQMMEEEYLWLTTVIGVLAETMPDGSKVVFELTIKDQVAGKNFKEILETIVARASKNVEPG